MIARRWMVWVGLLLLLASFDASASLALQWADLPQSDNGQAALLSTTDYGKHKAALDPSGNVVVVGGNCVFSNCGTFGHFAAKYDAATGAMLWRYATDPTDTGTLAAVAVDASGNVYVTGYVWDQNTNSTNNYQFVAKLSGTDGSVLWQVVGAPDQPTDTRNQGIDIVVDAAGNPYVAGNRDSVAIVTKYDPASGAIVWSSVPGYDIAGGQGSFGINVDPDGNIVGFEYVNTFQNSLLYKLTGATGERIWGQELAKRYVFPGTTDVYSFTLDGAGKPILAGPVVSKYSNADGSVIWEVPFEGSGVAYDVTALGNGDVVAVGTLGNAATLAVLLSSSGATQWTLDVPGLDTSRTSSLNAVTSDAFGNIVAGGDFWYTGASHRQYGTITVNASTHLVTGLAHYDDGFDSYVRTVLAGGGGYYNIGMNHDVSQRLPMLILKYAQASSIAGAKIFDLNGDGNADLVVQHADGSVEVRLMQGTTVIGSNTFVPSAPGHVVTTTGDFNGDGKSDLLYARNDGAVEMWLMDGSALTSITTIMPAGTGWSIAHVGDFNGDGKSDLLWRNTSGAVGLWLMDGSTVSSRASLMAAGSQWSPEQVGDFNADGNTDIVWRNTDGSVSMWLMNGTAIFDRGPLMGPGSTSSPIQVGDFNADGNSDLVFQGNDGSVSIWLMDGRTANATPTIMGPNTNWTVTQVGDFNADRSSDLIWTARDGTIGMWLMNGGTVVEKKTEMAGGNGWSVTVAEDLNADGHSDLVLSNSNGAVGAWLMNGTSIASRAPLEPAGSTNRVVRVQFHH
ncbi:MAG TPA: FG-GAP-like repeat-containing protein [Usitatibacter sp.]|jgi:hypothetical protein|nr:FG-GAP-like repeat-containing protein [Usitatibacter sp.]